MFCCEFLVAISSLHFLCRVGTLFVDENCEVRKFTSELQRIFMIIESDIGRPIRYLHHRLRDIDVMGMIFEVERTHEEKEMEVCTIENDWFLMRIMPYYVGPGTTSGLVLTFVDINPLRQVQEALVSSTTQFQASQARYEQLFSTMAEGVVYHNAQGEIVSANPSAERILGLTIDQLKGLTSIDPRWKAIHPDGSDFPGENHPAMVALKTGQPIKGAIMGIFNPRRNQTGWIRVNAVPLFEPGDQKPSLVYATFDDITEAFEANRRLYQAETTLQQTRALENSLANTLPSGIVEIDSEGMIVKTNPAWRELVGREDGLFSSWQEGSNCLTSGNENAQSGMQILVAAVQAVLNGRQSRVPIECSEPNGERWRGWVFRMGEESCARVIVMMDEFSENISGLG